MRVGKRGLTVLFVLQAHEVPGSQRGRRGTAPTFPASEVLGGDTLLNGSQAIPGMPPRTQARLGRGRKVLRQVMSKH